MEILLAIIGLLTGAIITWIIYNRKLTKLLHEREQLNMDLSAKTKEAELILQQMDRLERESQEHLEEQNREADLRIQELREQSAERIREQKELMNTQLQQQMQMMQERYRCDCPVETVCFDDPGGMAVHRVFHVEDNRQIDFVIP